MNTSKMTSNSDEDNTNTERPNFEYIRVTDCGSETTPIRSPERVKNRTLQYPVCGDIAVNAESNRTFRSVLEHNLGAPSNESCSEAVEELKRILESVRGRKNGVVGGERNATIATETESNEDEPEARDELDEEGREEEQPELPEQPERPKPIEEQEEDSKGDGGDGDYSDEKNSNHETADDPVEVEDGISRAPRTEMSFSEDQAVSEDEEILDIMSDGSSSDGEADMSKSGRGNGCPGCAKRFTPRNLMGFMRKPGRDNKIIGI